ncbi:ABC transporter permease [Treponema maltophilum]|uniref:ABC transporter permease n=1 Tax=Treponema maltophilum TaxID=51160 RepID=UPI003D90AFD3
MADLIKKSGQSFSFRAMLKKYGILFVLLLMVIVISIFKPEFLTSRNIFNILNQTAIFGIMAIGLTFVIISRGIDLSVGSILAFAAVVAASVSQLPDSVGKMFPDLPMLPFPVAFFSALILGGLCGAVSGFLIAKFQIHAFIATLGMMTVARGFALIFSSGKPISNINPFFNVIGGRLWGVIPVPVVIYAAVIAVSAVILNYTRFGKSVFAIGSNSTAAEISGINVKRNYVIIYMISGLLAGLASIVFLGRTGSAHPGAATGYELTAIAATTIGGTSQTGGIGTIWGAVAGALILGVIKNGMTLLGVHAYWQQVVEGVIIVAAVVFDMRKNARKA